MICRFDAELRSVRIEEEAGTDLANFKAKPGRDVFSGVKPGWCLFTPQMWYAYILECFSGQLTMSGLRSDRLKFAILCQSGVFVRSM